MLKNIIFINNFELYKQYIYVLEALRNQGYLINVICIDDTYLDWAIKKNFIIHKFSISKYSSLNTKFNLPWDWGTQFSRVSYKNSQPLIREKINFFKETLIKLKPKFVLGEKTWPHERSLYLSCKDLKINYLTLTSLRKPYDFNFFSPHYEDPSFNIKPTISKFKKDFAVDFLFSNKRPDYYHQIKKGVSIDERLKKIIIYFYKYFFNSYSKIDFSLHCDTFFRTLINKRILSQSEKCDFSKFCYFTHFQPEASIDYLGGGIRNNEIIFDWISHLLSTGELENIDNSYLISYKTHDLYKGKFLNMKNIMRCWPRFSGSSYQALNLGMVPITISGTIALEAIAKKIKPIVIGYPYFRNFKSILNASSKEELSTCMSQNDYSIKDIDDVKKEYLEIASLCIDIKSQECCEKFIHINHKKLSEKYICLK